MLLRTVFAFCLLAIGMAIRRHHAQVHKPKQNSNNPCPSGWSHYKDSCYFYEKNMLTFDKAEVGCLERDSLMFVADTIEEYKEVMKDTPMNYYTWVGAKQNEGDHESKWASGKGIKTSEIDWLTPAYKGFHDGARCVARFNSVAT
ncbi:unnamed protein product, partial [Strongylus vulgaris]